MHSYPQIVLALYLCLNLATKFYDYGKTGRQIGLLSPIVIAVILYWGGFWS